MANLLKVVLVPDDTNLPTEQAGVKYLAIRDIINVNGGGG